MQKNKTIKNKNLVLKRCIIFILNITYFIFWVWGEMHFCEIQPTLTEKPHEYPITWISHAQVCVPHVFAHVKAGLFFKKMLLFFPHCFLTWLEWVFGMDHKCLRQSSSFAQSEPVSPVVLLWADVWHHRGGRRGPSGLTQERQPPRRSPLGRLLLFCLLLAPQLLIDDNLDIVLRGTRL